METNSPSPPDAAPGDVCVHHPDLMPQRVLFKGSRWPQRHFVCGKCGAIIEPKYDYRIVIPAAGFIMAVYIPILVFVSDVFNHSPMHKFLRLAVWVAAYTALDLLRSWLCRLYYFKRSDTV